MFIQCILFFSWSQKHKETWWSSFVLLHLSCLCTWFDTQKWLKGSNAWLHLKFLDWWNQENHLYFCGLDNCVLLMWWRRLKASNSLQKQSQLRASTETHTVLLNHSGQQPLTKDTQNTMTASLKMDDRAKSCMPRKPETRAAQNIRDEFSFDFTSFALLFQGCG